MEIRYAATRVLSDTRLPPPHNSGLLLEVFNHYETGIRTESKRQGVDMIARFFGRTGASDPHILFDTKNFAALSEAFQSAKHSVVSHGQRYANQLGNAGSELRIVLRLKGDAAAILAKTEELQEKMRVFISELDNVPLKTLLTDKVKISIEPWDQTMTDLLP